MEVLPERRRVAMRVAVRLQQNGKKEDRVRMTQISRRNIMTVGSGLTLAGLLGLARPARADDMGMVVAEDGYSYMASDPNLTTWVQLIDAGGLQGFARAATPYTVFPATDAAFDEFPGLMKDLLGYQMETGSHNAQSAFPDTSRIVKLVRSHVVAGKHYPGDMMGKTTTVTTVAGTPLQIDATDPKAVKISWTSSASGEPLSATLVDQPITCVNAVIYPINHIEKM
jgi:uncharacterized surface protein with fasciclin (FAS1) repeats